MHDGGNDPLQLQTQISELSRKHDDVMSAIANFGNAQAMSIIYIPREKQLVPFSGELGKLKSKWGGSGRLCSLTPKGLSAKGG